jgi:hypothetical protein
MILTIFAILLFPQLTLANGAGEWRGLQGNDIAILEKIPFKTFVVDEEVTINGRANEVSVKYSINNKLSRPDDFTMLFPIEGNLDCQSEENKANISEMLNFEAKMNGKKLKFEEIDLEDVLLEGDYKKFQTTACFLVRFPIRISPGNNILSIKYNLLPQGIASDGGVGTWTYNYSIWPAKNWVSKFRRASWRVILPGTVQGTILPTQKHGEYFTDEARRLSNTYKINVEVSAPGERHDYLDHIEFEAQEFVPSGQISVNVTPRPLKWDWDIEACSDDSTDCILRSLKSLLNKRPYIGDKRCYDLDDLNVIREDCDTCGFIYSTNAIPFLRNEVFARKGYTFKADMFKIFFSDMPWYIPSGQDVKLNNIEKWNVDFLKKVEDFKLSDEGKLSDIYKQMKRSCPNN